MIKMAIKRHEMGIFLLLIFLSQVAAVAGWIAGLETAIQRMQVIMTVMAMPFCALTLSQFKGIPRTGAILAGIVVMGLWTRHAMDTAARNHRSFKAERTLAKEIEACEGCQYHISPRTGLGTRDRHDGCEILRGQHPEAWHRLLVLGMGKSRWSSKPHRTLEKRGYTTIESGE